MEIKTSLEKQIPSLRAPGLLFKSRSFAARASPAVQKQILRCARLRRAPLRMTSALAGVSKKMISREWEDLCPCSARK
jgi:hypothetical protein